MFTRPAESHISVSGQVEDWVSAPRIAYGSPTSHRLHAQAQEDCVHFALIAPVVADANATFRFNIGQNSRRPPDLQLRGRDGAAALQSGAAGWTPRPDDIQTVCLVDHRTAAFAIPRTAPGSPGIVNMVDDADDIAAGPLECSAQPHINCNNDVSRAVPARRTVIALPAVTAAFCFLWTISPAPFLAART
jgi:hypothetical protein